MPSSDDDIPEGFVPIQVRSDGTADNTHIILCPLKNELRVTDPQSYPMFRFIVEASRCDGQRRIRRTLRQVEAVLQKEKEAGGIVAERQTPRGFVFHLARCGSTLVANMLASIGPQNVVYSESAPPPDVIKGAGSFDFKVRLLRTTMQAMSRVPGTTHMYFKFQSQMANSLDLFHAAFPDTSFVFVHRDGTEVMSSLLRTAADAERVASRQGVSATVEGAEKLQLRGRINGAKSSPCLRWQRAAPKGMLALIPDADSPEEARRTHPLIFCAAQIAFLADEALGYMQSFEEEAKRGEHRAVGMGLAYHTMPQAVVPIVRYLFKQQLTQEEEDRMIAVTQFYSKAAIGRKDKPTTFTSDNAFKQATAPPEMKEAADNIYRPF